MNLHVHNFFNNCLFVISHLSILIFLKTIQGCIFFKYFFSTTPGKNEGKGMTTIVKWKKEVGKWKKKEKGRKKRGKVRERVEENITKWWRRFWKEWRDFFQIIWIIYTPVIYLLLLLLFISLQASSPCFSCHYNAQFLLPILKRILPILYDTSPWTVLTLPLSLIHKPVVLS